MVLACCAFVACVQHQRRWQQHVKEDHATALDVPSGVADCVQELESGEQPVAAPRAATEIDMPPESDPLEPPLALGEAVRVVDDAASERSCVDRARVWLEGLESSSSAVVCFGAAPDDPTQTTSSEQTHERERIAL